MKTSENLQDLVSALLGLANGISSHAARLETEERETGDTIDKLQSELYRVTETNKKTIQTLELEVDALKGAVKRRDDKIGNLQHENALLKEMSQKLESVVLRTAEKDATQYIIGDLTTEQVFKRAGLTDLHDLQEVMDQVEIALLNQKSALVRNEERTLRGFQARLEKTHTKIFADDPTDTRERAWRFFEEATELMQAIGITRDELRDIIHYTYNKERGLVGVEMGDVIATLVSLMVYNNVDFESLAENGLDKMTRNIDKIKAKRATRHGRGALPGHEPTATPAGWAPATIADEILGTNITGGQEITTTQCPEHFKFRMGTRVRKTKGVWWQGRVVGWYSTKQTPEGYAVQLEMGNGPVQIYPVSVLEGIK